MTCISRRAVSPSNARTSTRLAVTVTAFGRCATAVPALRAKYLSYVRDIADKWLDWNTLGPLAQKHHDAIAADVKLDTRKLYSTEAFESGVASLKKFADERRAYLLKATAPPR